MRAQAGTESLNLKTWRVTTAVRIFTLALSTGILLREESVGPAGPLLAALVLIASVCSALEWGALAWTSPLLPLGEGVLAAILLMSASEQPALLAYLAVPPIVAGVRHGLVTAVNAAFTAALAVLLTMAVTPASAETSRLIDAAPWLLTGLGVGVLASWQSRSVRTLEARQAPYAAANQLMSQLHQLAQRGRLGLDSAQVAVELETALRIHTEAESSAVFVIGSDDSVGLLASHGEAAALFALRDQLAQTGSTLPDVADIPLHGADKIRGTVLLIRASGWTDEERAEAQEIADEFVLRLDTAVLFDDVRLIATAEERNRLAREMHDGVAQEVVALGYIVDEIETLSAEPETRALAASLRDEISRVVTELRFSIFDLRHHVAEHRLSGALAEYVREVSHGSELRVHLLLDESGPPLPSWTESELLRVAQEAIGNVRKHAHAMNLWVTLASDSSGITLRIEDDGIGNAMPRDRHWGLQTMTERAERIGALLTVSPRPEGGTVVLLCSTDAPPPERTETHDHQSSTR
ncbi:histidine kinase [Nocardioides sp.]|uniref:sensor histidine kinase n=1 Tax=Nocardioides sp. TaxID=35761 RepID=UPI00286E648F|nr:histidine kinase [Nocardioides sp.]